MFAAHAILDILDCLDVYVDKPDAQIIDVIIDSRQRDLGPGSLFVALPGERTDGHQFLVDVRAKGVYNYVVQDAEAIGDREGCNVFVVRDTIEALQAIAAAHRMQQDDLVCVGITGSNGKTWVKEWLAQLLEEDYHIVKSPRSYNSQIGVPLSVLQIRSGHELGLFEAGISTTGEMDALTRVIQPGIGILTNIGDAHAAGFASIEQKLEEKCRLFAYADTIIYNSDDPLIGNHITSRYSDRNLLSWGEQVGSTLFIVNRQTTQFGILTEYEYQGNRGELELPFRDHASWHNAMTCCALLHHLGIPQEGIQTRFRRLKPVMMRLEIHRLNEGNLLINDAYSLDLASLKVGLDSMIEYARGMKKVLIISEFDQQRNEVYERAAALLDKYGLEKVFCIGQKTQLLKQMGRNDLEFAFYDTTDDFIAERPWDAFSDTAFLVKGARRFGLDQIADAMRYRSHTAVLEIDLNAMLTNIQFFTRQLKPGTRLIAMVKAAAYGTGGAEIARFLEYHNLSLLGVAYVDEGVDLRKRGVKMPIMVMNPDEAGFRHILDYDLQPEVYNFSLLRSLARYTLALERTVKVHVKIETGMHRLGFSDAQMDELCEVLRANPQVKVESVFTHLSAASDPDAEGFTRKQVEVFSSCYHRLLDAAGNVPYRHVLNSAGILNYPEYHYEAVRLGIGLYGVGIPLASKALVPVHALTARVSQVHDLKAGDAVGYNRAFVASGDTRIATVNVGYADGLPRAAGNGRYSLVVLGENAPIVGNVCMDMCMVDISGINGVREGDRVVVFDAGHPIEDLAEICGTIPYEILTGIGDRIPRVFNFDW